MTVGAITHGQTSAIPRPELHFAGKVAVGFLVLLGIGALAGGIALVAKPDGSVMDLAPRLLDGSPFSDYLIPGLILGGMFGIGALAVAGVGLLHWRIAPFLGFVIGCGQMIWIAVELAIIREFSFLHPTTFGMGLVIAVASAFWGWPTLRAWRANR
jgi:hypothetical protein